MLFLGSWGSVWKTWLKVIFTVAILFVYTSVLNGILDFRIDSYLKHFCISNWLLRKDTESVAPCSPFLRLKHLSDLCRTLRSVLWSAVWGIWRTRYRCSSQTGLSAQRRERRRWNRWRSTAVTPSSWRIR